MKIVVKRNIIETKRRRRHCARKQLLCSIVRRLTSRNYVVIYEAGQIKTYFLQFTKPTHTSRMLNMSWIRTTEI